MPKAPAKSDGYNALVKKITREFAQMERFVKNRVAQAHWNVGKYVDEHLLAHKVRAKYGGKFYIKLAQDTQRDVSTLQRSVQFYRAYPNSVPGRNLTWGHYRRLMTIKDADERKKLEKQILEKNWDTHKVQEYLNTRRRLAAPQKDTTIPQLTFTRGRLHTYRIVPADSPLFHRSPLALDFGFRVQYEIPRGGPWLKENETVELVFADGAPTGVRKVEAAEDELFTYKAHVKRVIDGDTLLASFDFHCPVSVSQKLRLRAIDCPEMDTGLGRRAKRFVEEALKPCPFIIVKTTKDRSDKFDRYLADVFYLPAGKAGLPGAGDPSLVAREGRYLNQELLDKKLAYAYQP